jgi:hypothetical protein
MTIDRRTLLKTGTLAAGSVLSRSTASETPQPAGFRHRGYLGWITDLASAPDPKAGWPSMRLDGSLLEDYRATFDRMRALGFNEISIWGLYVSRSWPVDIQSAVTRERGALVERLIDEAHRRGIRVYSGLGVYSWGFDEIIRANPGLSRGNPRAMCASNPDSWRWMQKVVDFVLGRFPVDGVSMQSADQGRCDCAQCRNYAGAAYHALLNGRVAGYIRSRWPGKTVAVNSWGMDFSDPGNLAALAGMSRGIDYLIDVHDTSRKRDPEYRRKLIASLACDCGTLGGPQVEPPQHWARDRWFLPTVKRQSAHLAALADEGGRACEYFFHILANPGDEISFSMAGRVLREPFTPWQTHLNATLADLFEVSRSSTAGALAELIIRSEDAYFNFRSPTLCGTVSLEPLEEDRSGPPIYVTRDLNAAQRRAYRDELQSIEADFRKLREDVPRRGRIDKILRCLQNAAHDLA